MNDFIKSLESEVTATKNARSEMQGYKEESNIEYYQALRTAHTIVSSQIPVPPSPKTKNIKFQAEPPMDTENLHVFFDLGASRTIFRP